MVDVEVDFEDLGDFGEHLLEAFDFLVVAVAELLHHSLIILIIYHPRGQQYVQGPLGAQLRLGVQQSVGCDIDKSGENLK